MSQLHNEGTHDASQIFTHQYDEFETPITAGEMIKYHKHLLGKLLTFIDAINGDREQKKAQKDFFRQLVWDTHGILNEWMYDNRQREVSIALDDHPGEWVDAKNPTRSSFPL